MGEQRVGPARLLKHIWGWPWRSEDEGWVKFFRGPEQEGDKTCLSYVTVLASGAKSTFMKLQVEIRSSVWKTCHTITHEHRLSERSCLVVFASSKTSVLSLLRLPTNIFWAMLTKSNILISFFRHIWSPEAKNWKKSCLNNHLIKYCRMEAVVSRARPTEWELQRRGADMQKEEGQSQSDARPSQSSVVFTERSASVFTDRAEFWYMGLLCVWHQADY